MNKYEYISSLERYLVRLPKADRDDILSDYEAHFARGAEEGKSEQEISAALGDPAALAAVYLENLPSDAKGVPVQPIAYQPASAQKASRYNTENLVIYVLLCIFAFVPIAMAIISVFVTVIGVAIGVAVGALALIAAGIAAVTVSTVGGIGLVLLGIALGMLTALGVVALIAMIKGMVKLIDWFIGWSRDFVSPVHGT